MASCIEVPCQRTREKKTTIRVGEERGVKEDFKRMMEEEKEIRIMKVGEERRMMGWMYEPLLRARSEGFLINKI